MSQVPPLTQGRKRPRHDNNNVPPPLSRGSRHGLALLACLQNALVGGVLYGFAAIDRSLLVAPYSSGGAGLTPLDATRIFSLASSTAMVSTLLLGAILDRYGPRICSVLANLTIVMGFGLVAIGTSLRHIQEDSWSLILCAMGFCFLAFGGPGIQVSIVHVANLFPQNQYLLLSGLNGCMSLSFSVFTVFDIVWELSNHRIGISQLFGVYAILVAVPSLVASMWFWPDEPFEAPKRKQKKRMEKNDSSDDDESSVFLTHVDDRGLWHPTLEDEFVEATTAHLHLMEQPLDSYLRSSQQDRRLLRSESYILSRQSFDQGLDLNLLSLKDRPFYQQVTSPTYIRCLLFLLITCFLANFYVASFSTEVRYRESIALP